MANGTPTRRKLNNSITENKNENELPPAPDGGWGKKNCRMETSTRQVIL